MNQEATLTIHPFSGNLILDFQDSRIARSKCLLFVSDEEEEETKQDLWVLFCRNFSLSSDISKDMLK